MGVKRERRRTKGLLSLHCSCPLADRVPHRRGPLTDSSNSGVSNSCRGAGIPTATRGLEHGAPLSVNRSGPDFVTP